MNERDNPQKPEDPFEKETVTEAVAASLEKDELAANTELVEFHKAVLRGENPIVPEGHDFHDPGEEPDATQIEVSRDYLISAGLDPDDDEVLKAKPASVPIAPGDDRALAIDVEQAKEEYAEALDEAINPPETPEMTLRAELEDTPLSDESIAAIGEVADVLADQGMHLAVEEPTIPTDEPDKPPEWEDAVADTPTGTDGAEIRIEDDNGHLLCMFNPATKSIEIKVPVGRSSDKGKMFAIDVEQLLHQGARNWLVADRVSKIEAKRIDVP